MKIGPIDTKPASQPVSQPGAAPAAAAADRKGAAVANPAATEASAKVALSASAQLLATAETEAGSFDGAKVERISQAIRDGKFVINADAIADKLIVNAEELLGKHNS